MENYAIVETGGKQYLVEPGDVIVRFDTYFIQNQKDLPKAIQMTSLGKEVVVQVIREKKMKTLLVTITADPSPEEGLAFFDAPLGMEIREVSQALSQKFELLG